MKIEKIEKLVANLQDKTKYVIHIKNLKQALNYGLVLKKNHRVIEFNQNAWLKPYIDMNTDLSKKNKKWFWKRFFLSWWITQLLKKVWKIWENIEILKLSQQKEQETIWRQGQIIILQSFSQKIYYQQERKNRDTYE